MYQNYKLLFVFSILLNFTVISPAAGTSKDSKTHQISSLAGKSSGDIGPLADGDPEDGEDSGGGENLHPTGYDWCQQGNKCCYQFTWQGYVQDIPTDPANTTCEHLKKELKADDMACFDPIIYTTSDSGSSAQGRGPNITKLEQDARENNWNVYCPLTQDKTCITLKYFSRGGGKQAVKNETRFCGSITETISGKRLTSGCWSEKVQGYVREVCACTTSICNLASSQRLPPLRILIVGVVLGTIFKNYLFM